MLGQAEETIQHLHSFCSRDQHVQPVCFSDEDREAADHDVEGSSSNLWLPCAVLLLLLQYAWQEGLLATADSVPAKRFPSDDCQNTLLMKN